MGNSVVLAQKLVVLAYGVVTQQVIFCVIVGRSRYKERVLVAGVFYEHALV